MSPAPLPALVRHPIMSVGPGPTASPGVNCDFKNFQSLLLTHLPLLTQQNWEMFSPKNPPPALLRGSRGAIPCI